jgi:aryl-alcohol dehydrogenase-like predicted oxidoreductase
MPGQDPSARRGSAEYIRAEAEASLSRLQVEVIDLYQMHQPDPSTPIAETLGALHDLVVAGKVRWIGISNFSAEQAEDAQRTARQLGLTEVVSSQDEYSLLDRKIEQELIPTIEHLGIGLLPYFPLASGLLTGKYRRGEPAPDGSRLAQAASQERLSDQSKFDLIEALEGFAKERGISLLTVAIGSLLARPVVASVIAGAMSPEQVAANFAAADWVATEEDWQQLDQITGPGPKVVA